jgi:hypothetical protein
MICVETRPMPQLSAETFRQSESESFSASLFGHLNKSSTGHGKARGPSEAMAPKENGRQSGPIPKANLCQDLSETTSQLERLEFSKLANWFAVNALSPSFIGVLA